MEVCSAHVEVRIIICVSQTSFVLFGLHIQVAPFVLKQLEAKVSSDSSISTSSKNDYGKTQFACFLAHLQVNI